MKKSVNELKALLFISITVKIGEHVIPCMAGLKKKKLGLNKW